MLNRLIFNAFIFTAISCSFLKGYAVENKDADIFYKVTIDNPKEGRINVIATFNKLPDSNLIISEQNFSEYLNLGGLKAKDEQGKILAIAITKGNATGPDRLYEQKVYKISSKGAKTVIVEYSVKPGTIGKHGHRGYLDEYFGLVPGSGVFLFPLDDTDINRIAVEFKLPEGWKVVCPWKSDKNIFVLEHSSYQYNLNMADVLCEAIIGFGNFEMRSREINGFNIQIYAFSEWSDEHIHAICEQAFRLMEYQLELFGINQKWDYAVIFVPNAADKDRVFGGSWSLGQGFEMETPSLRSWELLSHRFHHVFNYYYPLGMYMIKKSSGWFLEATASYYEIKALASIGYYKLENRISQLKDSYDSLKEKCDAPLSTDYKQRFQTLEYLHYKKAPLVAYLMDEKIKKGTNGEKDLDKFLKYIYSEHGMKRSAVNLKEELEQFTGIDFNEFFKKYVDGIEPIELAK
jgi:predicted metalloprotease with PDZ domain